MDNDGNNATEYADASVAAPSEWSVAIIVLSFAAVIVSILVCYVRTSKPSLSVDADNSQVIQQLNKQVERRAAWEDETNHAIVKEEA